MEPFTFEIPMSGDINLRPDSWSPASAGYRTDPQRSERANLRLVTSVGIEPHQATPTELTEVQGELRSRSLSRLGEASRTLSHISDLLDNVRHAMEYHAREQNGERADQELLTSMAAMAREIVEGSRFEGQRLFDSPRPRAAADPKLVAYHAGLKAFHELQSPTEDPRVARAMREASSALLGEDGLLGSIEAVANGRGYEAQEELTRLSSEVRDLLRKVEDWTSVVKANPLNAGVNRSC